MCCILLVPEGLPAVLRFWQHWHAFSNISAEALTASLGRQSSSLVSATLDDVPSNLWS